MSWFFGLASVLLCVIYYYFPTGLPLRSHKRSGEDGASRKLQVVVDPWRASSSSSRSGGGRGKWWWCVVCRRRSVVARQQGHGAVRTGADPQAGRGARPLPATAQHVGGAGGGPCPGGRGPRLAGTLGVQLLPRAQQAAGGAEQPAGHAPTDRVRGGLQEGRDRVDVPQLRQGHHVRAMRRVLPQERARGPRGT